MIRQSISALSSLSLFCDCMSFTFMVNGGEGGGKFETS